MLNFVEPYLKRTRWAPWRYAGALLLVLSSIVVFGCAGNAQQVSTSDGRPQRGDEELDPMAFQHFSVGTIAMAAGDLPTAITHFKRALRFDPKSYEIRMTLAEAFFLGGNYKDAIATASVVEPRNLRVLDFLGKCYRYTNQNDHADTVYREVIARDTTDASAYWYLSRLSERNGEYAAAAGYLMHAARLRASARYFQEAGDLFSRASEFQRAQEAYAESIKRDSTIANRRAIIGKAQAHEAVGEHDAALEVYQHARNLDPDDLSVRKRLISHYLYVDQPDSAIAEIRRLLEITADVQEETRLGVLLFGTERYDEAEEVFQRLQERGESYISLYYLGRLMQTREDFDSAKSYYWDAVAVDDTITDGWIALMSALIAQDSVDRAVEVADEAIDRTNQPIPFWYYLGASAARRQSYDSAITYLQQAHSFDSTDSRVEFALASALERSGRFAQSALMFSRLIRREPHHAPALNYLGYMYADSGIHLDESLELIERALAVDPDNPAFLDSYAWILYRLGRLEEAEEHMRKAIERADSDPVMFEHLGDILAAQGKDDEARRHWQHALEIDPQNDSVRAKLEP
ncbi:MAG: tetratricopeptide repeat protein [candidate division Zixibacteria bacterium]|nr:tetratricopeptide repeat protein [candidate division Zixibacteria bacterium]